MNNIKVVLHKSILCCILIFISLICDAQNFEWVKVITAGSNQNQGKDITTDEAGNVFTTGIVTYSPSDGPIDLNPGPGVFNVTESGCFVTKLNSNGSFVWAKFFPSVQGVGGSSIESIAIDQTGNITLAGHFRGTADLDPGTGTAFYTALLSADIFIAKLAANGNFMWAKTMPYTCGIYFPNVSDLTIDTQNNILVCGGFTGCMDFDPGPGISEFVSANGNGYVVKLNNIGDFVWAQQIGYTNGASGVNSIKTGANGEIYICGSTDAMDWDIGPGTFNVSTFGLYDGFVAKLDVNGNFIWVKNFGSVNYDAATSIAIDSTGMLYVTGAFPDIAYFPNATDTISLVSAGGNDAFIAKLNTNGDFLWAKRIGGSNTLIGEEGRCIVTDSIGNVYTLGVFKDSIDLDPGPAVELLTAQTFYESSRSVFILKLDTDGNYSSAKATNGGADVLGNSLALDKAADLYFTGLFNAWNVPLIDFDPGPLVYPVGNYNPNPGIFIAKWSQANTVVPLTLLNFKGVHKNTCNVIEWQTANEINTDKFIVQRSLDGKEFYDIGIVTAKLQNRNMYVFSDYNICSNCTVYYRLKITDIDGHFAYSNVILIRTTLNQSHFYLAPNPANDFVTLRFAEYAEKVFVSIYNSTGNVVLNHSFKMSAQNLVRINTLELNDGVYFVKVIAGGNIYQQQLIVLRPN